jgi:hypothetical protein
MERSLVLRMLLPFAGILRGYPTCALVLGNTVSCSLAATERHSSWLRLRLSGGSIAGGQRFRMGSCEHFDLM